MPRRGLNPHLWKIGPDPRLHDQYIAWQRAKAQCAFRQEEWQVSFDEWVEFWGDDWELRGRLPGQLRMTRIDWTKPWSIDNMEKMEQNDHNRHNAQRRV